MHTNSRSIQIPVSQAGSRPGLRRGWCATLVILALALFLMAGRPVVAPVQAGTLAQATPEPTLEITPSPTLNPEWLANTNQTNGILLGAAVLVLIIVGGSLQATRRKAR